MKQAPNRRRNSSQPNRQNQTARADSVFPNDDGPLSISLVIRSVLLNISGLRQIAYQAGDYQEGIRANIRIILADGSALMSVPWGDHIQRWIRQQVCAEQIRQEGRQVQRDGGTICAVSLANLPIDDLALACASKQALQYLPDLEELDLSGTQVTDHSLVALRELSH